MISILPKRSLRSSTIARAKVYIGLEKCNDDNNNKEKNNVLRRTNARIILYIALERRQPVANSKNPKRYENFFFHPSLTFSATQSPKVVIYKSPGDVNPLRIHAERHKRFYDPRIEDEKRR
ncbi:hypothetical protein QTP88_013442 [Uroleucon formosanum]